jgi:hypothetical protein
LINYRASTVERLVPHSTEFTIVDAIHRYSYGPFGQRRDKDSWRWLHDLIAFVSLLVEHAVAVVKVLAGARDLPKTGTLVSSRDQETIWPMSRAASPTIALTWALPGTD